MFRLAAKLVPLAICSFIFSSVNFSIAKADIILAPGDRVSLSVVGTRDLDTLATIESDGSLNLPMIGRMAAAGLTIEQLKFSVAQELSFEPIRLNMTGEAAVWRKIEASNVFVSVAEYRPVYVAGDVRSGGEKPFRPGMTVRQALVIAGGVGRIVADANAGDPVKLLVQRRLLDDQLALAKAAVVRLQAELSALEAEGPVSAPRDEELGPREVAQVAELWLAARAELRTLNDSSADLTLQQMKDRLAVLEKLEQVSKETLETYEEEYQRAQDLAKRGIVTAGSVTDAQRGLLSFSSRALEAEAEAYNVRTDIARNRQRTAAAQAADKMDTLRELLRSTTEVQDIEAHIAALEMQLSLLGEVGFDTPVQSLSVSIYRHSDGSEKKINASLDMKVEPGDVVEFFTDATISH